MATSLVFNESPLCVPPTLAVAIGLNEAIIYQQLYWLLKQPNNGKLLNGERWIFNTYEQWHGFFPFWSINTIQRTFASLESRGLIVSCQPDGSMSRRKYYRVAEGALQHLTEERLKEQNPDHTKLVRSKTPTWGVPLTEKTNLRLSKKTAQPFFKPFSSVPIPSVQSSLDHTHTNTPEEKQVEASPLFKAAQQNIFIKEQIPGFKTPAQKARDAKKARLLAGEPELTPQEE